MQKTITISIDEALYAELVEQVGQDEISRVVEDLIRDRLCATSDDFLTDEELEAGYRAMAADEEHEREALEWSEALAGDGIT